MPGEPVPSPQPNSEPAAPSGATIDHVELFVPDRRQAADWYARVLGLEIVREFESWAEHPGGPLMIGSATGGKIALFEGEPLGERESFGFRRLAFRLRADEFLHFLDRLEALGLPGADRRPIRAPDAVDHERAVSLYFHDPWGYPLEVTAYDGLDRIRQAVAAAG